MTHAMRASRSGATAPGFAFASHRETSTGAGPGTREMSVRAFSAMRVLFGIVFILDGSLKWILFQQGTMQATIQSFGYATLSNNWALFGALVALGETIGGFALVVGLFQRPAAIWSAAIMFSIWTAGGFGGAYVLGTGWSFVGYTDPGGDLMLALAFLVLIFSPYAYSLASRLKLQDRWPGNSIREKVVRFLVT